MNIELRRIKYNPDTIDGQLSIDGLRVCDCAENAHHCLPEGKYRIVVSKCRQYARKMPVVCVSDNANVSDSDNDSESYNANAHSPSHNAIANTNLPSLSLCSSCHRKHHIGINSSPHKKHASGEAVFCPMLAPGNGAYNRTDGAIIVGEYLVPGCLKHPKTAFDNLFDRIRKNIERGHDITLTIR